MKEEKLSLDKFISLTLIEISKGVDIVKDELKGKDVLINPILNERGFVSTDQKDSYRKVQDITFDLSVTASTESNIDAGAKITVVSLFSAGADYDKTDSKIATNRVKFSIPVSFQTNTVGRTPEERKGENAIVYRKVTPTL